MKSIHSYLVCLILNLMIIGNGIAQKMSPDLELDFASSSVLEVLIQFDNKLNIKNLNYSDYTKEEKGKLVYSILIDQAESAQKQVRQILDNKKVAYRTYSIANAIYCKIDRVTAEEIASLTEVIKLTTNPSIQIQEPEKIDAAVELRGGDPEWGIKQIQADSVWSLGYRGEGIVVAGEDTGYDWDNLLIKEKYRGWKSVGIDSVDHSYNWHDGISEISPLHGDTIILDTNNPCGLQSKIPCDDHGHGSHTMGTMVGEDDENAIGVAPSASWIGCRNMERGYGSPATYLNCFEWFLAPTDTAGLNPDPTLAPDVINNSWRCPEMEGCNVDNWTILETAVNNLKAAGIMVVASAGNDGPDCNTIDAPPAMFENAFVVGASNRVDTIANFSSRGTVNADSTYRLKPDVVAPGVQVRSIRLNDNFGTWNGTSMAGPHVAGSVALILSANPSLRGQVEVVEDILIQSAVPLTADQDCDDILGASVPNAVYGHGRIDALKAVELALGISNVDNQLDASAIKLYPNPGHDLLTVQLDNFIQTNSLQLFDISGKLKYSITDIAYTNSIPVSDLATGIYFVAVHTAKEVYTLKWIKQ